MTASDPRRPDLPTDWAGLAFFVLAAQFITIIMLGASMAPGYDIAGGAISDLGVIPETALLFNTSLVLTGILNIFGGVYAWRLGRGLVRLVIAVLAGIGAIGAGILPLSMGGWHGLFALAAFVFFNLQTLAQALRVDSAVLRTTGFLLAVLGLVYVGIMAVGDGGNPAVFGPIGHGGAERLIAYPPMLWLMLYGGFRLGRPVERR